MDYKIISPPFAKRFEDMTPSEAKNHFTWFLDNIPARISQLTNYVRSFPEYSNLIGLCKPNSLNELGQWFTKNVGTRKLSKNEMYSQRQRTKTPFHMEEQISLEDWTFTEHTFSLVFDLG